MKSRRLYCSGVPWMSCRILWAWPRRGAVAGPLAALWLGIALLPSTPARADSGFNPIVAENAAAGTSRWRPGGKCATGSACKVPNNSPDEIQIAGYSSGTSVNAGDSILFYVTSNPAVASRPIPSYSFEVFRLGYYGGTGGRSMTKSSQLPGTRQPPCRRTALPPAGSGVIECAWSASVTLNVPAGWTSGVYLARLENSEGYESYIPFVVRNDGRHADLIYQQPVTTYQAYNAFGGRSLYQCTAKDCTGTVAQKVSFDRPYGDRHGTGQLFTWDYSEQKLIFHLERLGYDIVYTTDIDTHANPDRLLSVKGFISAGHDEYWTAQMYEGVQAARDRGVNLAFLGGNDIYWQIRLEQSSTHQPNRIVTCYRSAQADPTTNPRLRTVKWRNLGRPEQMLIGVEWANGADYVPGKGFPFVVTNSSHWIFAHTGLTDGAQIPDVVGQEWDTLTTRIPLPPHLQYTIVAKSELQGGFEYPYYPTSVTSVVYQALSGAWVFAAGTVIWGHAVDSSPEIAQITKNVLDRFLSPPPARLDIGAIHSGAVAAMLLDPN